MKTKLTQTKLLILLVATGILSVSSTHAMERKRTKRARRAWTSRKEMTPKELSIIMGTLSYRRVKPTTSTQPRNRLIKLPNTKRRVHNAFKRSKRAYLLNDSIRQLKQLRIYKIKMALRNNNPETVRNLISWVDDSSLLIKNILLEAVAANDVATLRTSYQAGLLVDPEELCLATNKDTNHAIKTIISEAIEIEYKNGPMSTDSSEDWE